MPPNSKTKIVINKDVGDLVNEFLKNESLMRSLNAISTAIRRVFTNGGPTDVRKLLEGLLREEKAGLVATWVFIYAIGIMSGCLVSALTGIQMCKKEQQKEKGEANGDSTNRCNN